MTRSKEWCVQYVLFSSAEPRIGHAEVVLGSIVERGYGSNVTDSAEDNSIHSYGRNQRRQAEECVCGKQNVLGILLRRPGIPFTFMTIGCQGIGFSQRSTDEGS